MVYWFYLALVVLLGLVLLKVYTRQKLERYHVSSWDYEKLKQLSASIPLPAVIVDLHQLDQNIEHIKQIAKLHGKTIRIATKSVRVPGLIQRILEKGNPILKGLMCYSVDEAEFLYELYGYDDILIAYPTIHPSEIKKAWKLTQDRVKINIMVDSIYQVKLIDNIIHELDNHFPERKLLVCIDQDVSYRPLNLVHLGALRSPCRSLDDFKALVGAILESKHLSLNSVMGYEAQIGIPDNKPMNIFMNTIIPFMKNLSFSDVCKKRAQAVQFLRENNININFFNGGGTGSLTMAVQDKSISEITVGSAFLHAHLFDYYKQKITSPAFLFGLRITRLPQPGVVTCQSGGFIASGPVEKLSAPSVLLPCGLSSDGNEGFGEVQTPLHTNGVSLKIGDPVFFLPAKSGEIAERFNKYLLLENGKLIGEEKTYRGHGKCFY